MKRTLRRLFITSLYCGPNTRPVERYVIVPGCILIVGAIAAGWLK